MPVRESLGIEVAPRVGALIRGAQIMAGGKMITGAGQNDDPDIVVSSRLFERAVQLLEKGGRLRICDTAGGSK